MGSAVLPEERSRAEHTHTLTLSHTRCRAASVSQELQDLSEARRSCVYEVRELCSPHVRSQLEINLLTSVRGRAQRSQGQSHFTSTGKPHCSGVAL